MERVWSGLPERSGGGGLRKVKRANARFRSHVGSDRVGDGQKKKTARSSGGDVESSNANGEAEEGLYGRVV